MYGVVRADPFSGQMQKATATDVVFHEVFPLSVSLLRLRIPGEKSNRCNLFQIRGLTFADIAGPLFEAIRRDGMFRTATEALLAGP